MISGASTIFALSSGQVPSGIAIVRVSGPDAGTALTRIAGLLPPARQATRASLHDNDGIKIDEALVLWFAGPRSATGEDVAEFHVHGGRAVIAALVLALGRIDGLRPAEPGEFSRRAFENGKLDLVAAEGLDDLIHADTEQQRRQALCQLGGLLGNRARDWRQRIIDASALVEAGIDFTDEGDVDAELLASARDAMVSLHVEIDGVLASGRAGERLRDGLVVAITGPPNVGKSTLLNTIARRDVAIVTPHAGTTRDVLEVHLDLGGYPVILIDTAGLREATDPVEQEGIRRALARGAAADLVLWLTDTDDSRPVGGFGEMPLWTIRSKIDLHGDVGRDAHYGISSLSGEGIDHLKTALTEFAASQFSGEAALMTRARHRDMLVIASAGLQQALRETEPELIAEGLRQASHALGRLLGRIDVEDVLGSIFSRFCIGK